MTFNELTCVSDYYANQHAHDRLICVDVISQSTNTYPPEYVNVVHFSFTYTSITRIHHPKVCRT